MRMSSVVPTSLAKLLLEHSPVESSNLISSRVLLNPHSSPASVRIVGRVSHAGVCVNLGQPWSLLAWELQSLTKRWAGPTPVPTHSCLTR